MSRRAKSHGTVMMAASAEESGGSNPARSVSGTAYPAVPLHGGGSDGPPQAPMLHFRLNWGTVLKLVIPSVVVVLSASIYFYHRTNAHIEDKTRHLVGGERAKLHTVEAAEKQTKRIIGELRRKAELDKREIKVEQREQVQASTKKLVEQQRTHYINILNEVKRTRRDVRRAGASGPP